MPQIRQQRVDMVMDKCVAIINRTRLTTEEIVMLISQLLVQCGYSIHFAGTPDAKRPEKIDRELADELCAEHLTTGSALMQLGFDVVDALLKTEESEGKDS